jgi:DMSO/TMAO reductase YedYZ molybdopterin-dependent catalytic subunit
MTTRGFVGRRREGGIEARIPPGQYLVNGFPVLSYEPTPLVNLADWQLTIDTGAGSASWGWEEMMSLPQTEVTVDIHCVTKWSKLGTTWRGVTIDDFLASAGLLPKERYVLVYCHTPYTTNLTADDLLQGRAMVAHSYDGQPLDPQHGGPARLLAPHLYFWKSAKWVRGLRFTDTEQLGFWESYGYHSRGDPWLEQRYAGD